MGMQCHESDMLKHPLPVQDAASELYGMIVMSPTNYTRRAQPKYQTYGVPTEFDCVPPNIKAPFNKTEFEAYL